MTCEMRPVAVPALAAFLLLVAVAMFVSLPLFSQFPP